MITKVAGTGVNGYFGGYSGDGGLATSAYLNSPTGLALDSSGNLFIADEFNHCIRRVDAATGIITTVAGRPNLAGFSGDGGNAINAQLYYPYGVAFDAGGNLFIADQYNHRIRRVNSVGIITTVVGNGGSNSNALGDGGPALSANLTPIAITIDGSGSLFIADLLGNSVRKVDGQTGIMSNVAGNHTVGSSGDGGSAVAAALYNPVQMAVNGAGDLIFCDSWNDSIRKVVSAAVPTTNGPGTYLGPKITGMLSVSGTVGVPLSYQITATNTPLSFTAVGLPEGLSLNPTSGLISGTPLVSGNSVVAVTATNVNGPGQATLTMTISPLSAGMILTIAGTGHNGFSGDGGLATQAMLNRAQGLALDGSGNLYLSDTWNNRLRKIDGTTGIISTIAGNGTAGLIPNSGPASTATMRVPVQQICDAAGNVYFSVYYNHVVCKYSPSTGMITKVAGTGVNGYFGGYSGDGGLAISAYLN